MANRDLIEFEEPTFSDCDCCGERTTHLTRFVSREDSAIAVYLAEFAPGHDFVSVLASFGGWGDDSYTPSDRTAFAFRIWVTPESYQVGLVNGSDTNFKSDYFGRILSRDEALAHPLRQEVFDLSDHIVECDAPIIEFLGQSAQ